MARVSVPLPHGAQIFAADFRRLFNNCRHYNAPDTPYFKCANRLEAFFEAKARPASRRACSAARVLTWLFRRTPPVMPGCGQHLVDEARGRAGAHVRQRDAESAACNGDATHFLNTRNSE